MSVCKSANPEDGLYNVNIILSDGFQLDLSKEDNEITFSMQKLLDQENNPDLVDENSLTEFKIIPNDREAFIDYLKSCISLLEKERSPKNLNKNKSTKNKGNEIIFF